MQDFAWIGPTYVALDWVIRIGFGARIVLRRSQLTTSLAWLVIVLLLPFFGAFVYLLVGETRLGERRRRRYEVVTREIDARAVRIWLHKHFAWEGGSEWLQQVARYGAAVGGSPPLRGNALRLVHDSDDTLDGIAADIDAAESHVHMLFYIWQRDGRVTSVNEALSRAAKRGVACRVLVDAVGSKQFLRSAHARRLRADGVKIVEALPVNPVRMLFSRLDLRNHRKIVAVDGRVAWAGSANLTDASFKVSNRKGVGPWIDAMVRVEGPAAQALDVVFLRDWRAESSERVDDVERFLPDVPEPDHDESVVQVIPSGPGPAPEAIHQALLMIIYSASEEIVMTTPYFVPDEATRTALQAAAKRGVNVTLVLPARNDSFLVANAARSYFLDLLESGVTIMEFREGLLHAKTVTADRRVALIGSANFDMRSFWLNFESTLVVYDSDFASLLRFLQRDYIAKSDQVSLAQWRERSLARVAVENTAQLFAPLL